ncbi:MAG: hypothetical protein IJD67_03635 [Clostridia bacterium]|nr:hypothetical protein [Clostridia bacterium]
MKKILIKVVAFMLVLATLLGCAACSPSGEKLAKKYEKYFQERAAIGKKRLVNEIAKHMSDTDLLDVDPYGNCAVPLLYMEKEEASAKQRKFANEVIQKCADYLRNPPSDRAHLPRGEIDFAANRLVRALYAPEGRVYDETYTALKKFFLEDNFESIYFSENHMLMFRTARYLAACYYEGETFQQFNATAEEIRKIDHDFLVEFLQFRARQGWSEFDSMGYSIENFLSMINLYDCAPDEDLRELARMTLDTLLLTMICDSTENGLFGGAHSRSYDALTTDMHCRFFWVYELYFGADAWDEVPEKLGLTNVPFAYFSSYRPDGTIYEIVDAKRKGKVYPFSNYERTHNGVAQYEHEDVGYINKYTYNTATYSIGCVNAQDSYPDDHRDKYMEDQQQMNFSMLFAANSKATLTLTHPGGTNSHNYWYGDSGCNCNHFFGNDNIVTGIFFNTTKNPKYNFIHAYVPKKEFDEVVEQRSRNQIFVRSGDAYAVLRFSAPYSWAGLDEVTVMDGGVDNFRIGIVCEAGDADTYGTFEEFIAAMEKKVMRFNQGTLTLEYDNMVQKLEYDGKVVTESNSIDGAEQSYPYKNTYDSPFMVSEWDSGVITVTVGKTVRTMDFMNITDTKTKK